MKHFLHSRVGILFACLLLMVVGAHSALGAPKKTEVGADNSDLNGDGVVDLVDLQIFSSKYLEQNWETVDWCAFYDATSLEEPFAGKNTLYYQKHFGILLGFIHDEFKCDGGPLLLALKHQPRSLTRMAVDTLGNGYYYASDTRVGSVFIYDADRVLWGELKNLDAPLGVAIDSQGYLLVGNNGRDNVEVYDPLNGDLLATLGDGLVEMPTSIYVAPNGDIYVTDSAAHQVWVFESSYVHIRTIGEPGREAGQLRWPMDTVIASRMEASGLVEEVFVADQGNKRIQVFDLHGNFVRTINPPTVLSSWCTNYGYKCPPDVRGSFNKLQALEVDAVGQLRVLDIFEAAVCTIDPVTGALGLSFGGWGDGAGLLRLPLDVLLTPAGDALVTDSGAAAFEVFAVP